MAIALHYAQGLFSHMQEALRHVDSKWFTLARGVYQALTDFRWLA